MTCNGDDENDNMVYSYIICFGAIKVLVSSMPTSVVESIISKFELHQKLEEENTSISIDGKNIEGETKLQVIHEFNEALFLDKHYFPPHGKEHQS